MSTTVLSSALTLPVLSDTVPVLFIDHYLACDGRRLFLKKVTNRADVHGGNFPELHFQFSD